MINIESVLLNYNLKIFLVRPWIKDRVVSAYWNLACAIWHVTSLAVTSLNLHQEAFGKEFKAAVYVTCCIVTDVIYSKLMMMVVVPAELVWCESATGTESTRCKHQETAT